MFNWIIFCCLGFCMGKNFIAVLGAGKGTWGHVARIIQEENWDNILLVSNDFGKENFSTDATNVEWALINTSSGFDVIKEVIREKLPKGEIVLSLVSGSGKEHMAVLAALKEEGLPFEIVILTGNGTKYY